MLNDTGTQQEWYVDKNMSKQATFTTTDAGRDDMYKISKINTEKITWQSHDISAGKNLGSVILREVEDSGAELQHSEFL